jgi:hypothetical protein
MIKFVPDVPSAPGSLKGPAEPRASVKAPAQTPEAEEAEPGESGDEAAKPAKKDRPKGRRAK